MKKILSSLTILSLTLALAIGFSRAFFSDTETSKDNKLTAGKIDLLVDNTSYYNGVKNEGTTFTPSDLPGKYFFNFTDLKPDDYGEDTISLHVDDNDAWACMKITKTADDDNTCTEPEKIDDPTCDDPDTDTDDGELGDNLLFVFWADDGDNVLEVGEDPTLRKGSASSLFDGTVWPLADSSFNVWGEASGSAMLAEKTYYIGKAWCFGTRLAPNPRPVAEYPLGPAGDNNGNQVAGEPEDGGFFCDGETLNNVTQTDIFLADVEFWAEQRRHNDNFRCDGTTPSGTPTNTPTPTPSLVACQQADVILVLDRSGSIDGTELATLKTAAKTFIDDLGLSASGIHAGFSSFATTASLNQHLTDNGTTVKNAIDLLPSSGFTNLKEGIDLAIGEHANPGDNHDREDVGSPDKMIIITDGHPNRPLPESTADDVAKASADAARSAGAEVYVVGIGSDVNASYLQTVANDAGHYYPVSGYGGLQTVLQNLDLCD